VQFVPRTFVNVRSCSFVLFPLPSQAWNRFRIRTLDERAKRTHSQGHQETLNRVIGAVSDARPALSFQVNETKGVGYSERHLVSNDIFPWCLGEPLLEDRLTYMK
jgi:hypothetical protein